MYKLHLIYRIIVVTLCVLIVTPTSVSSEFEDKLIFMFDNQFVALVPQDNKDAISNHQPVIVSVFSLSKILSSVLVKIPKKNRSNNRLFGDSEILILSQTLSSALAKASPEQDIMFKTQSDNGNSANLAVKHGRAFWRDGKLHLLFAEIQDPKNSNTANDRQLLINDSSQFGSRSVPSNKIDFNLIANNIVTKEKDINGVKRSDWISIDTNLILGYTIEPLHTTDDENVDSDRLSTMKEELAKLKYMKQKGLISEKNYQKEVRELLDEAY